MSRRLKCMARAKLITELFLDLPDLVAQGLMRNKRYKE